MQTKSRDGWYTKAVVMLKCLDISMKSLRLDKYFSCRKIVEQFDRSVTLFLIPKKNLRRIKAWRNILGRIVASPIGFLKQYFKRNLSECCFSADK
jgi:transposase